MIPGATSWADANAGGGVSKPSTALWVVTIGGAVLLSGLVAVVVLTEPKKVAPIRGRRYA